MAIDNSVTANVVVVADPDITNPSLVNLGLTTIVYTATYAAGNTAMCTVAITLTGTLIINNVQHVKHMNGMIPIVL